MNIDVARRFTSRLTRASIQRQAGTAELAYNTGVPGVPCFIEPRTRRFLRREGVEVPVDLDIMFLPDQALAVGDKLSTGTLANGALVFSHALIVYLDGIEHPLDGRKFQVVYASDLRGEVEAAVGGALYTWIQNDPMWASITPLWADYSGTP